MAEYKVQFAGYMRTVPVSGDDILQQLEKAGQTSAFMKFLEKLHGG